MTPVLIIGGTQDLQQYVTDALTGRGREVALLDPARETPLDDIIAASGAVLYLHDDGHERRRARRAARGRPQDAAAASGWDEVHDAVKKHKTPCVSAAKGARKGKGTVTEIRLPEVYGVDQILARSAGARSRRGGADGGSPGNRPERVRGPQGRRVVDPLAAEVGDGLGLVDEWITTALAGREIMIERDGSKLANFVLIDDLAEVLADALVETETNGDVNKPIVFGDDQAVSEIDAALLVARIAFRYNGGREVKVTGGKGTTRYIGHEHARGRGRGDQSTLDEVGWSTGRLTPLEDGVVRTMQRRTGR